MQVKREHLAGLELARSIIEENWPVEALLEIVDNCIDEAKAAPFVTGAEVVAFVKGDDAHRVISWHPDKPAFAHPVGTELIRVDQYDHLAASNAKLIDLLREIAVGISKREIPSEYQLNEWFDKIEKTLGSRQ